jgi:hypothetical protein
MLRTLKQEFFHIQRKKILISIITFLVSLLTLQAAEEISPASPLPPIKTSYLCQFIFVAFDNRNPLNIKFSRTTLSTAKVIEQEDPVHEKIKCSSLSSDKALRILLEDFNYVKQHWTPTDYRKYFQEDDYPFALITFRLQTVWLMIDGEEVPCSWDYHPHGMSSQPVHFHQPLKQGFTIQWAQNSDHPVRYKADDRPLPTGTHELSETIIIERNK